MSVSLRILLSFCSVWSVWCPHCARQKELLGREAWQYITYIECSPQGYGSQPLICNKKGVDGYPTWIFKDKSVLGGERPLEELAKKIDFVGWNPALEENVPPPLGSTACKQ
jgi:glutaredoxin